MARIVDVRAFFISVIRVRFFVSNDVTVVGSAWQNFSWHDNAIADLIRERNFMKSQLGYTFV